MQHPKPMVSAEEQAVLEGVAVRPITGDERAAFGQRLIQDHYLHSATLVGEQLRYVAEYQGRWVALLTWNAAAFNLQERERWIGWSRGQKRRRLSLVVNNSRCLVLPDPANLVQGVELNRRRLEARCLIRFAATAEQVCFPAVAQAARQTRASDRPGSKSDGIETDWLITSRPAERFSALQMAQADRAHWGIENGFHLRLDVTAGEDRSRVRHPTSVLNLAMIRRAVLSLGIHWIQAGRHRRQATLQGFYDAMASDHRRKALSLVTSRKASWLPT